MARSGPRDMTDPHENHTDLLHLRAHIAFCLEDVGTGSPHGYLPLGPRTIHSDGSPSLGSVATMIDVVGMRAVGHDGPMVTSHLALRLPGRPTGSALRSWGRSIRNGKTGGTALVHVVDDEGSTVGVASLTGAALTLGGGTHVKRTDGPDDFFVRRPHPTDGPGPEEYIGLEPAGRDGSTYRYRTAFHESLRNVNGVLHGGGACLLAEQAARCAAIDIGSADTAFDTLDVHFLAPGLSGPFLTHVEALSADGDQRAFVVEVFDTGRDHRPIALGLLTGHTP